MLVAYQIGHEALKGKISVAGVKSAIKSQPVSAAEILIAGLTETLETMTPEQAVAKSLKMLQAAARQIDASAASR